MSKRFELPAWTRNPIVRGAGLTVLWLVLLTMVVIPTWRDVVRKGHLIDEVESQLSTLDQWTVAGLWLAPAVAERSLPINAAFSRLYPSARDREALFLDLARVADASGVEEFGLSESGTGFEANDVWSLDPTMARGEPGAEDPPTDEPPADGGYAQAMTVDVPSVELSTYRIKAGFSGDYRRAASFMAGLERIERALKVHSLVVRPLREGIQVEMELDVYVDQSHQS